MGPFDLTFLGLKSYLKAKSEKKSSLGLLTMYFTHKIEQLFFIKSLLKICLA
jgi:hypothetical protein